MNAYDMIMKEIAELPETLNVTTVNIYISYYNIKKITVEKKTLVNTETPVWIAHENYDGECAILSTFLDDTFEEGIKQLSEQLEKLHLFNPETLKIMVKGTEKGE